MNLVCPACATTNRVPDARLREQPVCGRCGAALMALKPANLTDATLPAFVANTELPVLAEFMNAHDFPHHPFSAMHRSLVSVVAALVAVAAYGAPLDDMVALDAVYIPALALTTAAARDLVGCATEPVAGAQATFGPSHRFS